MGFRYTPPPDCAPVAQLDRAPDYESGGWKFESFRARQLNQPLSDVALATSLISGNILGNNKRRLG